MTGNVTWRDSGKEAAIAVTVDGSSSTEEWLHVSGAVSADSQGDEHSLTTHALVRYDGAEKVDMQATGSYDGAGASVNTTLSLDGEDSVRFAGHVRSADVASAPPPAPLPPPPSPPPPSPPPVDDIERRRRRTLLLEFLEDDTEVEMAAFLVYDNEQGDEHSLTTHALVRYDGSEKVDMQATGSYDGAGASVNTTLSLDGEDSVHFAGHVQSKEDDSSEDDTEVEMAAFLVYNNDQGDEHSLTTHALVRYDGSEKVDMQATGSYDGAGASVNTTLSLDGEDSVHFTGHVQSKEDDSSEDDTEVEMAAFLVYNNEQGDEHSLTTHILVRYDGAERVDMQSTGSYDDAKVGINTTMILDGENSVHFAGHVQSMEDDSLEGDTEVEMAAFLVYDNEQVFDMTGNITWRDSGKEATMTVTVDGSSSTEEWLHGDEHSLTTHALVRYDGAEKVDMQATGSYDGAGASVNTTLSLDGEDSVRFAGHGDEHSLTTHALVRYDGSEKVDMQATGSYDGAGASVNTTLSLDGEDSVRFAGHGDEHSLTTHALVRYDGAEKVDMQATGSYDGTGASVNTTLSLDGEDSVRFAGHVRSADVASPPPPAPLQPPPSPPPPSPPPAYDNDFERRRRTLLEFLEDDTEVEMAAFLVYDNEQGDEHSLTTHALVRAREERGCCLATPTGSSATSTVITPAFTVSTTVTFTASTTVSTTLTTFTATTTVSTTLATFTVTRTAIAPACL
ncbi:hypothetical protein CYMTET_14047 [Cymbomonas tetramitiformis]|uniref:Uncharacterized protein n=1 Tax=Cymbomonas tetramitiformis TaxID=36881 RepID=A0AAE0LAS5_9CHLO|nr:hypothetical protein CYMTET_14047 [Cymbomonas tetramitiformis]